MALWVLESETHQEIKYATSPCRPLTSVQVFKVPDLEVQQQCRETNQLISSFECHALMAISASFDPSVLASGTRTFKWLLKF